MFLGGVGYHLDILTLGFCSPAVDCGRRLLSHLEFASFFRGHNCLPRAVVSGLLLEWKCHEEGIKMRIRQHPFPRVSFIPQDGGFFFSFALVLRGAPGMLKNLLVLDPR